MNELNAQQIVEGIHYQTGLPVQVTISDGIIQDVVTVDKVAEENPVYIAP